MQKKITSFHLKLFALISMFIDHFGAAFFVKIINAPYMQEDKIRLSADFLAWVAAHRETLIYAYEAMRYIGRIAFPVYCFLLVEGFVHTKSVSKYALRLGIFALISEIPFDLAFNNSILELGHNNVFITLLFGLALLWCVSYAEKVCAKLYAGRRGKILYSISVAVISAAAYFTIAHLPHADYGVNGVLTVLIMYLLRKKPLAAYGIATAFLTLMTRPDEAIALVMLVPLYFYNGERGKSMKYFFYMFYPVHLMVLSLICILLGIY